MAGPDELLQQLCRDLRVLWMEAGGPNLRTLAGRVGLGKSQVSAILNGKVRRPPDWEVVKGVIESVRRYADDHGRDTALSLRTGLNEYWAPRYAVLEHAFRQTPRRRSGEEQPSTSAAGTQIEARPAQLPAAVAHFAGRSAELAGLTSLLDRHSHGNSPVLIAAICGTAGVGKTALAVHWAHQVRHRFPDGQLYVNLRGFDPSGSALNPATVTREFLDALGVTPLRFPTDPDALAALYRSELAGRRLLIVLDNARESSQIRPLLPGTPGCLVLVTSRNHVSGLVTAHGAHTVNLDLPSTTQARELLAHRVGADRVSTEADAVDEIIRGCARLPLALSIVAAHATSHPHLPLQALSDDLRDAGGQLDALTTDDAATDVRAVFSWSFHALSPDAARLFRLLGLHPGPDFAAPAAASLAALELPRAHALLAELTRANLVMEHVVGRYTFHDLLRAYATEQANSVDSVEQRHAALHRILDHYLHTGCAAAKLFDPTHSGPETLRQPPSGVTPQHLSDRQQALAWFTAERAVLLAAVHRAAAAEFDTHVWQFASILTNFLFRQVCYWDDLITVHRTAMTAADRSADPLAQARAHGNIANVYSRLGQLDEARIRYQHSLELATEVGALQGQAIIHANMAHLSRMQDRHAEALDHAQQAALLSEADGNLRGKSRVMSAIGLAHAHLGDPQLGLDMCRQGLAMQLELDDQLGLATTWHDLGDLHHTLGQHSQAIDSYQRALDLRRDLNSRYDEAETLAHLGDAHHAADNQVAARQAWLDALTILDQLHHPDAADIRARLAGQW